MTQPRRALRRYEEGHDWQLIHGEALRSLYRMPAASVDLCLTDVPYGTTSAPWDSPIPAGPMWEALRRVMKPSAPTLLFSAQPFTSALVSSNRDEYRYSWYWMKGRVTNFAEAARQPLRCVEEICVFGDATPRYFPQGLKRVNKKIKNYSANVGGQTYGGEAGRIVERGSEYVQEFTGYPWNWLTFTIGYHERHFHPNRKPVALNSYLIKTYTQPGDVVLDFTCGSGSSGEAAVALARKWVGIERDTTHAQTAVNRVSAAYLAARRLAAGKERRAA